MTVTRQPQALQEAQDTPEERSWAALVRAGGYLSPAQRQAFEKAIALVTDRMRDTLEKPATQVAIASVWIITSTALNRASNVMPGRANCRAMRR